jgi:hypothetical protein
MKQLDIIAIGLLFAGGLVVVYKAIVDRKVK